MKSDITIIASTIPSREHLLLKSLTSWAESIVAAGVSGTICLYAEGYQNLWTGLPDMSEYPGVTLKVHTEPQFSGSQITGYNYWIARLCSPVVIFAHPEIILPKSAVATALRVAKNGVFTPFKCYFLNEEVTREITSGMMKPGALLASKRLVIKYDPREKGDFYFNSNTSNVRVWESVLCYAMTAETVRSMYPYRDFKCYGRDDPWHHWRRGQLGIKTETIMDPIALHQWHVNESEQFDADEVTHEPPDSSHHGLGLTFQEHALAHQWCKGHGLEIGAGAHNPFGLKTMNVDNVDHGIYQDAQIQLCGHAARVDILADGDDIPVDDDSQDFVISSHVLEHMLAVPALLEWNRVTRPDGIIFIIHPLRDALVEDSIRPLTSLQHHADDYANGLCTTPAATGHNHVETLESLTTLVEWMKRENMINWELVTSEEYDTKVGNGFTLVYRKLGDRQLTHQLQA